MRVSGETKPPAESETLTKAPLGSLRYLRGYLRPYTGLIILACIALITSSGAVLGLGYGLRYLVDQGISQHNMGMLNRAYGVLFGVILLLAIMTFLRYFLVTWIGERVVADIRRDMYSHLLSLDITFYETHRTGELLSRLTTDTTLIQTVVGSSVSIAMRNTLLLTGGLIMLCVTSLQLTAYVLLIVPLVVLPIIVLGKKVRRLSRETQDKVADLNAHAEESVYAIATIQALTLENRQQQRFSELLKEMLATSARRIRMRSLLTAIVITLVLGAISTVLWFGGKQVIAGTITPGELSSFVFYAVLVAGSTGAISEVIGDLQRAAGAVERLASLKSHSSALRAKEPETQITQWPDGDIYFDHVSFAYPSRRDQWALHDVSFTISKGKTVAIVGPSGSGKTTIFRLLLRYYDPASGTLRIGNTPLPHLPLSLLRRHIGIVPQDPVIFSASAYDNILIGYPEASEAQVREAAQMAEILPFLDSLPQGMDSHLGEKGIRLSGGQRQRLAIARSLLRSPDILLLDEATSALDSENERKVQQALEQVMQNRTTLIIAHRLSTVKQADQILLINNGEIEAVGTHDALFAQSSLYERLAKQQFSNH